MENIQHFRVMFCLKKRDDYNHDPEVNEKRRKGKYAEQFSHWKLACLMKQVDPTKLAVGLCLETGEQLVCLCSGGRTICGKR